MAESPAQTQDSASETAKSAEAPHEPGTAAPPEVEPAPQRPVPPPPPQNSAPPPTGPEVALELCEQICKKMDGSCSERAAAFCRASCGDYENAALKCPVEVETALSCQMDADDFLLCSNISAQSCAPLFKRLQDCRSGAVPPQERSAPQEESQDDVPPGFGMFSFEELGFEHLMPLDTRVERKDGLSRASSASGSGPQAGSSKRVEYSVEQLPDDPRAPTDKSILRTATRYLGNECQPKLRLRGRFETQNTIHVRFDTVCEDGTEKHGMFHFFDAHTVAAMTRAAPGAAPPEQELLEAFLFSFERKP